jgi:hypothetical protein
VAPPSRGIKGDYQFIEGSLDDLDRLPILRGIDIETPIAPALVPAQAVVKGIRNKSLFEQCMREAHYCDDLESLLDVARTRNEGFLPPMTDAEVLETAKSAWSYTERGENRFGQTGAWLSTAEVNSLIAADPDDLVLLTFLRANNGRRKPFIVANGLADKLGWTRKRLARARRRLERSHLQMVKQPSSYHGAALYRWRSRQNLTHQ